MFSTSKIVPLVHTNCNCDEFYSLYWFPRKFSVQQWHFSYIFITTQDGFLRRWINNLLCLRTITFETYGTKTSVTLTRGTLQGRVISPTLWLLVIDELLKRLDAEGFSVIGYADDVAIICKGKFLNTIISTTHRALCIVKKWCKLGGLRGKP